MQFPKREIVPAIAVTTVALLFAAASLAGADSSAFASSGGFGSADAAASAHAGGGHFGGGFMDSHHMGGMHSGPSVGFGHGLGAHFHGGEFGHGHHVGGHIDGSAHGHLGMGLGGHHGHHGHHGDYYQHHGGLHGGVHGDVHGGAHLDHYGGHGAGYGPHESHMGVHGGVHGDIHGGAHGSGGLSGKLKHMDKSTLIKIGGAAGVGLVGKILHDKHKSGHGGGHGHHAELYGGAHGHGHFDAHAGGHHGSHGLGRSRLMSKIPKLGQRKYHQDPLQGALKHERHGLAASYNDYQLARHSAPKLSLSRLRGKSKVVTPDMVYHGGKISSHSDNIRALKSLRGVRLF